MIIVVGHVTIADGERDRFIELSQSAVEHARKLGDCSHFAVSADPLDPDRVDVAEVWTSRNALEAFREGGPPGLMLDSIVAADIAEYECATSKHPEPGG